MSATTTHRASTAEGGCGAIFTHARRSTVSVERDKFGRLAPVAQQNLVYWLVVFIAKRAASAISNRARGWRHSLAQSQGEVHIQSISRRRLEKAKARATGLLTRKSISSGRARS